MPWAGSWLCPPWSAFLPGASTNSAPSRAPSERYGGKQLGVGTLLGEVGPWMMVGCLLGQELGLRGASVWCGCQGGRERELSSFRKGLGNCKTQAVTTAPEPGGKFVGLRQTLMIRGSGRQSSSPSCDNYLHCPCRESASSHAQLRTCPSGTKEDPLPLPHTQRHFSDSKNPSLTARGQTLRWCPRAWAWGQLQGQRANASLSASCSPPGADKTKYPKRYLGLCLLHWGLPLPLPCSRGGLNSCEMPVSRGPL